MSCLAIITARGGSKRIPKKNIKDFCGKPIIAYSIEAAISSKLFDEVMVSTDDEEIAEIAKLYGAKVPFFRSEKNSDDFATTADVLDEVINKYKNELNKKYDYICCIYPTAPFITANKLKEVYNLLILKKADTVIPVVKYSFPPQRCFIINNRNCLQYKWPENQKKRSQDLESYYHDAGQFYFYKADVLYNITEQMNIIPYILSDLEVQDIDNEEDWKIAEIKYRILNNRK